MRAWTVAEAEAETTHSARRSLTQFIDSGTSRAGWTLEQTVIRQDSELLEGETVTAVSLSQNEWFERG